MSSTTTFLQSLLCAEHYSKHFTYASIEFSYQPYHVDIIIIPML